jgi:hypothetical protein
MSELTKLLGATRAAAQAARERLREIGASLAALDARRSAISGAPLTKADFLATMARFVAERGEDYARQLRAHFGGAGRMTAYSAAQVGTKDFVFHPLVPAPTSRAGIDERIFFFFLAGAINSGMAQIADAIDWPADAVQLADRPALLDEIDRQREALQAERDAIREALGDGPEPIPAPAPEPAPHIGYSPLDPAVNPPPGDESWGRPTSA